MTEAVADFKETVIGPIPQEWETAALRDLATEFFGGGTPSTRRPEFWDGDIEWTTSAHIDGLYLNTGARSITSLGLAESSAKLVPQGNLLIGTRVGVGKVAINAIDVAISQDLTGAIVDKTKVYPEFLAYAMQSASVQESFRSVTRGTTIKGVPRKDLIRIPVPLPPLPEQRRIAHVLSTIQQAIAAQDDLIAAARELKHSLMQRLFTYGPGPEPAPTKETEIGEIPGHWRVVRLGVLIASGPQNGLYKPASFYGRGTPILRIDAFSAGDAIEVPPLSLKTVQLTEEEARKYALSEGDIVVNRVNGNVEILGKCALVGRTDEPVVFESNMMTLLKKA